MPEQPGTGDEFDANAIARIVARLQSRSLSIARGWSQSHLRRHTTGKNYTRTIIISFLVTFFFIKIKLLRKKKNCSVLFKRIYMHLTRHLRGFHLIYMIIIFYLFITESLRDIIRVLLEIYSHAFNGFKRLSQFITILVGFFNF